MVTANNYREIMLMKIPFHKASIDEKEINAVSDVLKSGWLTMGEKTFEFERLFSEYTGACYSVAVNSCTSALHLALKAIDLKPGDEVIIPAITFIATWEVVTYFGAVPVIADVEKDTHLLDAGSFESLITSRTKAVIAVHYSGQPCDMDRIIEIAKGRGIFVIEDAAHSLPAFYKNRPVGSIGDFTCFSFYATKTVTTGEGGMITTCDESLAERIRSLRLHGISRDAWNRYSESGTWQYDVMEAGYKYNPTDISSAIGIEQLKKSDEMNERRSCIASMYNDCFSKSEYAEIYTLKNDRISSWHLYPLKIRIESAAVSRDEFIKEMKLCGISTGVHFIPLYRFSCFTGSGLTPEAFPGSEYVFNREVSLPIFPGMAELEVEYVAENALFILAGCRK